MMVELSKFDKMTLSQSFSNFTSVKFIISGECPTIKARFLNASLNYKNRLKNTFFLASSYFFKFGALSFFLLLTTAENDNESAC